MSKIILLLVLTYHLSVITRLVTGTKCKATNGKACIFPFINGGKTFYVCDYLTYEDYFWCATSVKDDGNYDTYGTCPEDGSCPLEGQTATELATTTALNTDSCQKGDGEDYSGIVSKTKSGLTCEKWSIQKLPQYNSVGDHNYCRNPDGERGVWCFSKDPPDGWAFCDVPLCSYVNCTSTEFACTDRWQCIEAADKCDGITHCKDGSDEHLQLCGCPDPSKEFLCGDDENKCIPHAYVCDGKYDCEWWSDEFLNCANCTSLEFACADQHQCIEAAYKCDDKTEPNCKDGSDEVPELCDNCTSFEFTCISNWKCIKAAYKCDGIFHCEDGSDERVCVGNYVSYHDGHGCGIASIRSSSECGNAASSLGYSGKVRVGNWGHAPPGCHVAHPSDDWKYTYFNTNQTGQKGRIIYQSICHKRCPNPLEEFRCGDGSDCVSRLVRCDGQNDCADGSDELEENCGNCNSLEFACADGIQCIKAAYKCDDLNKPDCKDGSDEVLGLCDNCSSSEFTCVYNWKCIKAAYKCDGIFHCEDGSDEFPGVCGHCTSSEFVCADGSQCIKAAYKCDDITDPDCVDESDEDLGLCGCPDPSREVLCGDGNNCIPRLYRCDGYNDCADGSDELEENCVCSDDPPSSPEGASSDWDNSTKVAETVITYTCSTGKEVKVVCEGPSWKPTSITCEAGGSKKKRGGPKKQAKKSKVKKEKKRKGKKSKKGKGDKRGK